MSRHFKTRQYFSYVNADGHQKTYLLLQEDYNQMRETMEQHRVPLVSVFQRFTGHYGCTDIRLVQELCGLLPGACRFHGLSWNALECQECREVRS